MRQSQNNDWVLSHFPKLDEFHKSSHSAQFQKVPVFFVYEVLEDNTGTVG